jgi:hypothetical protein
MKFSGFCNAYKVAGCKCDVSLLYMVYKSCELELNSYNNNTSSFCLKSIKYSPSLSL